MDINQNSVGIAIFVTNTTALHSNTLIMKTIISVNKISYSKP